MIPFSIVLRLQINFLQNYSSSTVLEFFGVKTVGYERYATYVYRPRKSDTYIQWLHSYKINQKGITATASDQNLK